MVVIRHPAIEDDGRVSGRWSLESALEVVHRLVRHEPVSQVEAERAVSYLDRRFLKVNDTKRILGIKSPTTLKKWIAQGAFPGAHRQKGQWMFPADQVYALRDGSLRAARMNAARKIEQQVYEGDDLYGDLGL